MRRDRAAVPRGLDHDYLDLRHREQLLESGKPVG
jgi:hypothetical protein